MKVLNFTRCNCHNNLINRRKVCTIRLGDKSMEYRENEIVLVTLGNKFSRKKKIYTAIIDKVFVKPLCQLTRREYQGENSVFTEVHDLQKFLNSVYGKNVNENDLVTVLYFSEIFE